MLPESYRQLLIHAFVKDITFPFRSTPLMPSHMIYSKFICLQLPSFGSYCYLDFKGNILNFHKSTIKKILITKCEVKYKGR